MVIIGFVCVGCSKHHPTAESYRPAIRAAVRTIPEALTNSIVVIKSIKEPDRLDFTRTFQNLSQRLHAVDVTQCPEDFRVAWIDMVHTIANYRANANIVHGVVSGTATVVAVRTGSREAGDVAARQFEEITTKDDIKLSFQRLETICMKYGVQMPRA